MPDVSGLGKDELANLCSKLYEQSCAVFGEKFNMEQQVETAPPLLYSSEINSDSPVYRNFLSLSKKDI